MARFHSISDQIIAWANKSENEQDARTIIQVIRLVFEKATDETPWPELCARLCRKMMEQISPNVRDDGIKNADGKPIAGGQLFRKYLLNRCQEDFERGWVAKEATAVTNATEGQAAKAADGKEDEESALYSEENYAAQKAKRQGLGLIKFIGELFKLQMLTERIMHKCVKKLLGSVETPVEVEIERLCKLLTTVGQILDTPKARAHMDVYFSRMKELCKNPNVSAQMQFMLQEVIELRERKWAPLASPGYRSLAASRDPAIATLYEQGNGENEGRGGGYGGGYGRGRWSGPSARAVAGGPATRQSTIAALREQIEKEKPASDKDAMNRTLSMSRGGSRRGGDRNDHQQIGPDGLAAAGGPALRQPPKAGDLSNFGKLNKSTPMAFGPSSVFQKDKTKSRESTLFRQGSTNTFSMLSANPEIAAEVTSAKSTSGPSMSVEEANTQISEDLKEFFSIRDLNEADVYFTKLPAEHRHLLVDKLVTRAVESKEADAQLVADLFDRAHSKNLVSSASYEEGFNPVAETIDDIAIDAPKALNLFAIMMKGAHLHEDEERCARLTGKSMDSDKLVSLLSS
ncbi:hypothetical protein VTO73DRAFT_11557 [Trametes versicolor]